MRIVVAGQRSFGAAIVGAVYERGYEIAAVLAPGPNDATAREGTKRALVVNEGVTPEWLRHDDVDLVVAAHSHAFIGRRSRMACNIGAIGFHPSLLPRHRGRDAVRWTIKMRDPIAGGSVYWLSENVDGGDLAAQDWCHVDPRWDRHDLWRVLFPIGVRMVLDVLDDLKAGRMVAEPQQERFATWEPSWEREPLHRPELIELGAGLPVVRSIRDKGTDRYSATDVDTHRDSSRRRTASPT